jgi:GT2 family glycosyltransferase/glycosyltransferase involved in cell wall biosynthesis
MIDPANCRLCIDQPQTLFATHGGIHFSGWCFDTATDVAPLVRLTVAGRSYLCTSKLPRPDVGAAFPDFPQAANCGFALKSWMPSGYRKAHLEISADDAGWSRILTLPLCAEMAPLIARIDFPTTEVVEENPVTVSGWALHPQEEIQKLFLQVGGSSFACHYGKPRLDLVSNFPELPQSGRSGFYCQVTIPTDHVVPKLKAILKSGRVVVHELSQRLGVRNHPATAFLQSLQERRAAMLRFAPPDRPLVSIIIAVYDQIEVTLACLKSIAEHTTEGTYEIIVVDDNSSEPTARCLQAIEGIRLIRHEANQGFLRSCNEAAAAARGEYLLFLNNDTEVTQGWLTALTRVFERRADAGLVGAKLVYPDGRLQEAGGIIWRDASGVNYGKGDHADKPEYNYLREVDYCSGACIQIPRILFQQLGGFDPIYAPAYYEDTDLAFNVRAAGRKVYYQPLARIIHHEGQTSGTSTESGVKSYQVVNQKKFRQKWTSALARQRAGDPDDLAPAKERGVSKRAFVVDARVLCPDQDSGSVRMLKLLTILQDLGFLVTFAPYNGQHLPPYTERMQELGIECLYAPFFVNFQAFFSELEHRFDLIILSRAETAEKVLPVCRDYAPSTPIVFDTVDLHFVRRQREAELTGDKAAHAVAGETQVMELKLAAECDAVLVVSPDEKEILAEKLPGQRIEIVSNIHETRTEIPPYEARRDFLFIGGFEHTPNVDAMLWFVKEIMPRIRLQLPGAKLHIIGSKMPRAVRAMACDDVLTHGYVENVDSFFESCLLSVAPLRWGAGVKGKINQSMSFGVPVVSTTIGVEGMYLSHGENVLVADTAAGFADEVVRLYRDPQLWRRLSTNSIKNVEEYFSLAAARRNLERLLVEMGVLSDGQNSRSSQPKALV